MSVSAVLVTGFLGTGKTTFIANTVLPALGGRRFALLVNDFGEENFDGKVLRRDGLDVVEIEGGCICCSAGGEMMEALARIRNELRPEVLVIEGSGISDPFPMIEALETEGFHIEGIPCLVDPRNFDSCRRHPVFGHQVEAANLFVLSKCDMASDGQVSDTENYIRLAKGNHAGIWRAFDGEVEAGLASCLSDVTVANMPSRRKTSGKHDHKGHHHSAKGFSEVVLRPQGAFRKQEFLDFLAALPPGILRVKGICQFVDSPAPLAINWSFGYSSFARWEQADRPFLVVIGEGILEEDLCRRLPNEIAYDYASVADVEMLPEAAFDRRPGVAFIDGEPVTEIDAVEKALDICSGRLGDVAVIADPNRISPRAMEQLGQSAVTVRNLDGYAWNSFQDLLNDPDLAASRIILCMGVLSGFAALIGKSFSEKKVVILSDAYSLPNAAVSVSGMTPEKYIAFADCLKAASGL